MLRNFLAVVAGLATNTVVVTTAEWLNMRAFPLPAEANLTDPVQLEAALRGGGDLPYVGVLAGIIVAAFLAGAVTGRLAAGAQRTVLGIGLLLLVANVVNAFSFWHPVWFRVAVVVLPLPLAWWGGRLLSRAFGGSARVKSGE